MNFVELTNAILNTLLVCCGCIVAAVPCGAALAVLLVRTDLVGRRVLAVGLGSQLATPLYVFAGSWNAGFGGQGWWPLSQVVAVKFDLAAFFAVIFIHAAAAIPWVVLIVSCGLIWSQRSLEESAMTEQGNRGVLFHVLLPGLRPWLALSCMWVCVPVLTEMVVTNLYQVPTVAEQVYLDASRGTVSPLTYPVAVVLCMLPIVASFVVFGRKLPAWSEVIARACQHVPSTLRLGGWKLVTSLASWFVLLILIGLPIVNLIVKAGWQPYVDANGMTRYGWTFARLIATARESFQLFHAEFYWSAMLAAASATASLGLAVILATLARSRVRRFSISLLMLVMIGTPGAMVGVLCISLFNRAEPAFVGELYDRTLAAPILAQQFRLLPLAWMLTLGITAMIDRRSWELARGDGLSYLQTARTVLLPQTGRSWVIAWLILALVSVGELSTTILVLPPGVTTLSKRLFEMLHFGMRHQDSGLCLVLIFLGWLAAFSAWKTLIERKTSES